MLGEVQLLLKVFSVTIVLISILKVTLGARADRVLDPTISAETASHPSIDSQVRFYGGAFSIFGVLLWMSSNDLDRYGPVFQALMIVFFLSGLARIPGAIIHGRPSVIVIGLGVIEVVVPPLLLWWYSKQ